MTDYALHVVPDDSPAARVPPVLQHRFESSGLRAHALPPGRLDVTYRLGTTVLDINLAAIPHEIAVNSDRLRTESVPAESVGIAPPSTELRIRAENVMWGALIELDPDRAASVFAEASDGRTPITRFVPHTPHRGLAAIARQMVTHFRAGAPNRLFLESLGLAALGLAFAHAEGGMRPVSVRGNDARIARAIDALESRLGEALTVGDLASVACLSAGQFARVFKATTGEAVWAYVQRRRGERALELIRQSDLSLAEIAVQCGFAHQGHFTTCFKRQFGATPGKVRQERL